MTDEKEKKPVSGQKPQDIPAEPSAHTWVDDMKQELEDYIEEQGIYIRQ